MQNLTALLKRMRNEKSFIVMVNPNDQISFSRNYNFRSVTIIYNIGTDKKKMTGFDARNYDEMESWLRQRFDFHGNRKIEPSEIKFL